MKAARLRFPAALIALVGLVGLLWLEDFGTHTDDGCQVEIHCLACRAAVVRPTSARAHVDPTPVLVALCQAEAAPSPFVADVCRASGPTRGPPSPSL